MNLINYHCLLVFSLSSLLQFLYFGRWLQGLNLFRLFLLMLFLQYFTFHLFQLLHWSRHFLLFCLLFYFLLDLFLIFFKLRIMNLSSNYNFIFRGNRHFMDRKKRKKRVNELIFDVLLLLFCFLMNRRRIKLYFLRLFFFWRNNQLFQAFLFRLFLRLVFFVIMTHLFGRNGWFLFLKIRIIGCKLTFYSHTVFLFRLHFDRRQ